MIALVIGGGHRVWRDVEEAERMAARTGHRMTYFAANDMIAVFPKTITACTLHPSRLPDWLTKRAGNGLDAPAETWSHAAAASVENVLPDWGGSSGLFAAQVAMHRLPDHRVVLCGVPMTPDRHFMRGGKLWTQCKFFRRAWEDHIIQLRGKVTSLSGGWTEEKLGKTTEEWLA